MFNSLRCVFPTIVLVAAFSDALIGQQTMVAQRRMPFNVEVSQQGLTVLSYDGEDGLLQPGDIISWVATPESEDVGVEVSGSDGGNRAVGSEASLKAAIFHLKKLDGTVALWVRRGGAEADWVIINVDTLHASVPPQPEGQSSGVVRYSLAALPVRASGEILGDIKLTAVGFAQQDDLPCSGQTLSLYSYQTLFAVLPEELQKDGRTTFLLPDMGEAEKKLRAAANISQESTLLRYVIKIKPSGQFPYRWSDTSSVEAPAYPDWFLGDIRLTISSSEIDSEILMPCDGRALNILEYQPLYSLIEKVYGSDSSTTFKLPDLRKAEVELRKSAGISATAPTLRYYIAVNTTLFPQRD